MQTSVVPSQHRLSPARRSVFTLLATLLGLGMLELCASGLTRFVDIKPAAPEGPDWLISQREAFKHGAYIEDPHTIWRLAPGATSQTGERQLWGLASLRVNDHGMRSPSVTRAKPAGVQRALVVGGSHPMGMYVEERAAYSAALERRLNRLGGPTWQVLNAAVMGHTTWQGLQYVRHYGLAFEPDVVIFDLGMNDDLPLSIAYASPDEEITNAPAWSRTTATLLDRTAVGQILKRLLAPAAAPPPGAVRVPADRGLANARALEELGRGAGFEPLFVQQVGLHSLPGQGHGETAGRSSCTRDYAELDPRVLLCDRFSALADRAERYFVDSMHANEAGHALIADAILEAFQREGWAGAP